MTFLIFIGLILLAYSLSYFIMHALAPISRKSYRLFRLTLFPGVVIHELSHALACVLTGTPVTKINFWTETGGSVEHHLPRYRLITQPIISLAPFVIGLISLLALSRSIDWHQWTMSFLLILLMVSIAATLAPSKIDLVHAGEGIAVLLIVSIFLYFSFPSLGAQFEPSVKDLNHQLLIVNGLLALIWLSLWGVHHGTRRVSRST